MNCLPNTARICSVLKMNVANEWDNGLISKRNLSNTHGVRRSWSFHIAV